MIQSIQDLPFLGFGYGTFMDVFPLYRDASVGVHGFWDKAHNTPLEVIQGLGLPVSILLFAGIGWLIWYCFSRCRINQAPQHAVLGGHCSKCNRIAARAG